MAAHLEKSSISRIINKSLKGQDSSTLHHKKVEDNPTERPTSYLSLLKKAVHNNRNEKLQRNLDRFELYDAKAPQKLTLRVKRAKNVVHKIFSNVRITQYHILYGIYHKTVYGFPYQLSQLTSKVLFNELSPEWLGFLPKATKWSIPNLKLHLRLEVHDISHLSCWKALKSAVVQCFHLRKQDVEELTLSFDGETESKDLKSLCKIPARHMPRLKKFNLEARYPHDLASDRGSFSDFKDVILRKVSTIPQTDIKINLGDINAKHQEVLVHELVRFSNRPEEIEFDLDFKLGSDRQEEDNESESDQRGYNINVAIKPRIDKAYPSKLFAVKYSSVFRKEQILEMASGCKQKVYTLSRVSILLNEDFYRFKYIFQRRNTQSKPLGSANEKQNCYDSLSAVKDLTVKRPDFPNSSYLKNSLLRNLVNESSLYF